MTELLRSALNYLTPSTMPFIGTLDHPLIGATFEMGSLKMKYRSLIAEGGYALVFAVQDTRGNWYALKRQLAVDREAMQAVMKEIQFLKELTGHPAILRYVQGAQQSAQEGGHGRVEYLLLTELCPGTVIELIQKGPLTISQVAKIFYAACSAIKHMHGRKTPITHRDMKIENLLFDATGHVKLCDFGSATTEIVTPDENWSALRRTQLEEELARYTTPMYRAPELLDMYSNFPVGPAQDVWALGCVLYYLCYRKHPFEDSAKLRIINAKYTLPDGYNAFHPLIQSALRVDPRERPLVGDLCERVETLAKKCSIELTEPVEGLDFLQFDELTSTQDQLQNELSVTEGGKSSNIAKRSSPSTPRRNEYEQTAQQASAVFGAIKGQGMSWLKNIKDKTAAVAQTVQSTYGNRGPDVTFITSRLVVAPLADGVPDALATQAEEAMRVHIVEQARGQFAIYNLSSRRLKCDYGNLLSETPLPSVGSGLTPTVKFLMNLCRNMVLFLKQKQTNIIVITGPEVQCSLVAAALLLYARLIPRPLLALDVIYNKRPLSNNLPPSYHRQLDLITTIVSTTQPELREMVHNRPVVLQSLLISPVPLFNRARTGCRPFVEIYAGGTKVWSTYKSYEELKSFEVPESCLIEIPLDDIPVGDDVQLAVYHARWIKMQNRMQQHLMFSVSFHASFIDPNTHMLEVNRGDLDRQTDDDSKFGEPLKICLQMKIGERDRGFVVREPPVFFAYEPVPRMLLVSEPEEFDAIVRPLGLHRYRQSNQRKPPERPPLPRNRIPGEGKKELIKEKEKLTTRTTSLLPQNSFFSTLQWQDGPNNQQEASQENIVENTVQSSSQQAVDTKLQQQPILQCSSLPERSKEQEEQDKNARDITELYGSMYNMRVCATEGKIGDDLYKFDHEKQSNIAEENLEEVVAPVKEADLLGLGTEFTVSCSSSRIQTVNGVKSCGASSANVFTQGTPPHIPDSSSSNLRDDATGGEVLVQLGDTGLNKGGMERVVSAPVFAETETVASTSETKFDPFAEFLASKKDSAAPSSKCSSASASGRATPNSQQRPSYSRAHFDALSSIGGAKPKNLENAFDDLLTSQGFQSSTKTVKSLDEMKRQEEIKEMDPVMIKVRDWTKGKEGNIRALLSSLNEILWPGGDSWSQPSIGDLLTAQQVKKFYRKACLVIHPDKQVGTENEALARAVFTELNNAWTAFVKTGSPSI